MGELWSLRELGDVGVSVHDCEHKTPVDAGHGYPYIAIPNIIDGRLDLTKTRKITLGDLRLWNRRVEPKLGDIILTRRGRVGDSAVIPSGIRCAMGQNLVLLRSDGSILDQRYLRWAVRGPLWYAEVDRVLNVGAVFSSLNVRDIPRMKIPVPPLKSQREISNTLSALDDKIAVNERVVSTCDELRALSLQGYLETAEATQKVPLSSVADFINGRAFTKDATGTGRMVVRIAEINSGPGASTVYNDIDVPDQHVAHPGDILFAWSGSLTVARWYRPEAIINQHIFKVLPKTGMPTWLAFELTRAKLDDFRLIAAGKATTMGHIQRRHLDEPVLAPTEGDIGRLDEELGPLWDRALIAEQENLALAELRDTLLPRLMSGELRVREAEGIVGGAL